MTGSTFGKLFKVSTWGESHGEALGCIIEGVPSKIKITEKGNNSPQIYGFSAGDVGGLDEADKFLSLHPADLVGDQIEVMGHVDELPTTNLYMNSKSEYLWLREGQEKMHPSFQDDTNIIKIPSS